MPLFIFKCNLSISLNYLLSSTQMTLHITSQNDVRILYFCWDLKITCRFHFRYCTIVLFTSWHESVTISYYSVIIENMSWVHLSVTLNVFVDKLRKLCFFCVCVWKCKNVRVNFFCKFFLWVLKCFRLYGGMWERGPDDQETPETLLLGL